MNTAVQTRGWFIGGKERHADATYPVNNPYTNQPLAYVAEGSKEMMREAIEEAHKAFQIVKKMTKRQRAQILFEAAALIELEKEEAAQIICLEACKPIKAARGEVERTIQTLQFSGEEAKRLDGEYLSLDAAAGGEGRDAYTIFEPIGVVAAITPFNFPLNLTIHKVGPAIAAGNTIVIKPAEQTPLSSLYLADVLTRAGLPEGAIAVVPGEGPPLGEVMLEDERVKKISFTGSPRVGKLLKNQAGLKKMTLELGSNSAMYVDKSVTDMEGVADKAVQGAFSYNGQVCLSTQRIYVHNEAAPAFKKAFVEGTKKLQFGAPDSESTDVSSLINKNSIDRILSWIEEASSAGAEVLTGGQAEANGVLPTVLGNVPPETKVSCQEVFGPVVLINEVKDENEALEAMNDSVFGLNAGVFTNDLKQALHMAHELEVGQVLVNDVPTLRFDHMPYGGVKQSGYGREGVKYAIREMSELKMISLNFS
ncbi:aldehyde dehydrogenase family protein [Alkalicoccus halolimnae]|uniref:Aldehyde dehydrogenase family protein n=1 Tax=Alkalicoccus halolimnae TaxID=1667239 RepID=A0A5C7F239_9BACI|nr:aldehyde dehydrogenase family protein [Alkalicoccus halolimnae]TXF82710.1 aldehyde dehydrogenase family protein [Alkalicoccus halolimnae]